MTRLVRLLCLIFGLGLLSLAIVPDFTRERASYECSFGFRLFFAAIGGLLIDLALTL